MVTVYSITLSTTPGAVAVSSPGGVAVVQILTVQRSGTQYDKVALGDLNNGVTRQWAYNNFLKQIKFPTALPFNAGELVYVIYKTII